MTISQIKKELGLKCCAYACNNKPIARKGGLCHKHYRRKLRETNPVLVRYENFKYNALARGKEFSISLNQFKDFCKKTGYIIQKGKRGMNATVDRRCNIHGYHIWNIQLLTHRQNCIKGTKPSADCPF